LSSLDASPDRRLLCSFLLQVSPSARQNATPNPSSHATMHFFLFACSFPADAKNVASSIQGSHACRVFPSSFFFFRCKRGIFFLFLYPPVHFFSPTRGNGPRFLCSFDIVSAFLEVLTDLWRRGEQLLRRYPPHSLIDIPPGSFVSDVCDCCAHFSLFSPVVSDAPASPHIIRTAARAAFMRERLVVFFRIVIRAVPP